MIFLVEKTMAFSCGSKQRIKTKQEGFADFKSTVSLHKQ